MPTSVPAIFPANSSWVRSLVGQAAQSKRMLVLDARCRRYVADHIAVTSGLGEATRQCSLIVPFLYEGRVVGVIEMGTLDPVHTGAGGFLPDGDGKHRGGHQHRPNARAH